MTAKRGRPRADQPHVPTLRRHASGQGFVRIRGTNFYLGKFDPAPGSQCRRRYDALMAEWLGNGRSTPPTTTPGNDLRDQGLSVGELLDQFCAYLDSEYPANTAAKFDVPVCWLRDHFGDTPVAGVTRTVLDQLVDHFVDRGCSRRYINENRQSALRVFRWGCNRELVADAVVTSLSKVEPLRLGSQRVREKPKRTGVADYTVDSTLPHLHPTVADMVKLLRLTAMRPSEVCNLRPCDVERGKGVWTYIPTHHKTAHLGQSRVVVLGTEAQNVLRKYLLRVHTEFCFNPRDVWVGRRANPAKPRRVKPTRTSRRVGTKYTPSALRVAIQRGCQRAFPPPKGLKPAARLQWRREHSWSPYQIRHATLTKIAGTHGAEAARVVGGHSTLATTQIYLHRDMELARRVALATG